MTYRDGECRSMRVGDTVYCAVYSAALGKFVVDESSGRRDGFQTPGSGSTSDYSYVDGRKEYSDGSCGGRLPNVRVPKDMGGAA